MLKTCWIFFTKNNFFFPMKARIFTLFFQIFMTIPTQRWIILANFPPRKTCVRKFCFHNFFITISRIKKNILKWEKSQKCRKTFPKINEANFELKIAPCLCHYAEFQSAYALRGEKISLIVYVFSSTLGKVENSKTCCLQTSRKYSFSPPCAGEKRRHETEFALR